MLAGKLAGRNAGALKYDLLTVMGAYALGQDKGRQRLVLRLMTLVTARYNWARDELAVGQRDIARLWRVDERTVKREMAKLRAMGWLVMHRQGARGRVSEYGLGIDRILLDSQPRWADVGPDLEQRLGADPVPDKVVPLHAPARGAPPDPGAGDEWALARALLHSGDPGLYASWFSGLDRVGRAGGRLTLRAPSRFHATYVATHLQGQILAALQSVDATLDQVVIDG
ncbi:hypothetical protein [Salipiger aestuarii]|uniref:hypothetical protein n=1 Tax=Salipiger aestuarii TaxID=568098 RepID=UPI00123A5E0C|nr:hypothetical protein [Salipiger aestuarii]KAA8607367.1 hypothetical protein AL037_18925 [Salipiger aestuarii]